MESNISNDQNKFVIFMGASVMDLISYTERFPEPGETVSGKLFLKGFGGKAANACIMCSRLGLQTAMLAKIGDDIFGREMIENFNHHKTNIDNLFVTNEIFTSTAAISVNDQGQNSIIYVPGPSNLLTPNDIKIKPAESISKCKLLITTFECTPVTLFTALSIARKNGVKTLVNAAPPFTQEFDQKLYSLCDILCLNESEASIMTGLTVNTMNDGQIAMSKLLDKGCNSVILTMGSMGALYMDNKLSSPLHISIDPITNPVDTTGAGDAFVGSLAYFLVCHPTLSIEEKLKRSCEIASLTVLKKGTQSSYPWRHQLPIHLFE